MTTEKYLEKIIDLTERMVKFWRNAHGWAPISAASLMSKSRLDWQLSLSQSLQQWVQKDELSEGDLILAWANLGALVEGALKLFLSVYYEDYKKDLESYKKKESIIDPDILKLEQLRQFIVKKDILTEWHTFITHVQQRRNAIHAFRHREIGDSKDFLECIEKYFHFLADVNSRLPYPDTHYP